MIPLEVSTILWRSYDEFLTILWLTYDFSKIGRHHVQVETRAAMLLTLEVGRLLGIAECNKSSSTEQDILRLLTPLAKLYTAKQVGVLLRDCMCVGTQHHRHYHKYFNVV